MIRFSKIIVVGGGSSGWSTAIYLKHKLRNLDVTLVESPTQKRLGVGESTNTITRHFNKEIGLEEKAFLNETTGSFKSAIEFVGFNRKEGVFYHPFGFPLEKDKEFFNETTGSFKSAIEFVDSTRKDLVFYHPFDLPLEKYLEKYWFKNKFENLYYIYHVVNRKNLFDPKGSYAYHVDADKYSEFLRKKSVELGVKHIVGTVENVLFDEIQNIKALRIDNNQILEGDLFVDCSGFKALLMSEAYKEPFLSIADKLPNDSAVATKVPYMNRTKEMRAVTTCWALDEGWVWIIPLKNRIGSGFVYSSKYTSKEAAEEKLRQYWGIDRTKELEVFHIKMRTGRHERAWVKNCVAIGPAYGFIEPLESTGISLTQHSIMTLARVLSKGSYNDRIIGQFNKYEASVFDNTVDFIQAHYILSKRKDSAYWQNLTASSYNIESLKQILDEVNAKSYRLIQDQDTFYTTNNWNAILSGMEFFNEDLKLKNSSKLEDLPILSEYLDSLS